MRLPTTGTAFEAKYEILETLGAGGFATVFKARDVELGREVAIKILAPRDGDYPQSVVARFMVEARVIAQLRDAHTIRLFEFGKSQGGLLYMVFQYVAGEDLGDVLQRTGALPPETVVHVGKQIAGALAEAHEIGILHRDLKPGNVLIHEYMGDPYTAKLLDFGIAKVDDAVGGVSLTKTGALLGTPRYMSPEQAFAEPLGPTTDIYSLGLVLYEMLVGCPALEGSRKDVLREHAAEKRHYLPAHVGWPSLNQVIERMLAHEPHARYQSAVETSRALEHALQTRYQPADVAPQLHSSGQPLVVAGSSAEVPAYTVGARSSSSSNIAYGSRSSSNAALVVRRDRSRAMWALGALVAVIVVGGLGITMSSDEPAQPPIRRVQPLPSELLKGSDPPAEETISPPVVVVDAGAPPDLVELTPVDLSPSNGCGKVHDPVGERWLKVGVGDRKVRVYLPRPYKAEKTYPLVVGFGPKYESEGGFAKDSGLVPELLKTREFVAAIVEPSNRFDPWEENDVDEAVARGAIEVMKDTFCIDPRFVYGLGHHDGGRFLRQLACVVPFAGIAISGFAEKLGRTRCDLRPHVPTLIVAALDDEFIPADGGMGCTTSGPYAPVDDRETMWRERYRCESDSSRLSKTRTSECTVWTACDAPLAYCRANGGHHLASSSWLLMYPHCRNDLMEFNVGAEAWTFFKEHGREISPLDPRFIR